MTSAEPPTPSAAPDPYAVAAAPESIRVPEWMRQPETEHTLTRPEKVRLLWERHAMKLVGTAAGVLAVALLGVLAWSGFSLVQRTHDGVPLLPGLASSPSPAPRPVDDMGNSLGPFVATPAEKFAAGEEAITLPAARATAPFTGKQVADALAKVRQALIQGRLEPSMLGGRHDAFLALLAADAQDDIRKEFGTGDNLGYATRILADAEPRWDYRDDIRAQGTVTYRSTKDRDGVRVLEITTRFIWVYSFDLPRPQAYPPGSELVTLRDQVVWQVPHPDDVTSSSRGLWVDSADVTVFNATCAAIEKGAIDLDVEDRRLVPGPQPTGDIYDPGWRPGDGEDC
ncbi:hypothetical protein ACFOW4_08870 [Micromonospora sp. GCM10011542]|uniref:hypothetical protein n=1 Tax=Micromonospora sp. GCM10011542 TaxID=3317337 RepID=UPI003618FA70